MIDKIKTEIYSKLQILFAEAVISDMSGDSEAYNVSLGKIATIAEALEINMEVTLVNVNLKSGKAVCDAGIREVSDAHIGIDIPLHSD